MKTKEKKLLEEKTKEELEKLLKEKRLSLVKLWIDLTSGKSKNTAALARIRDEIAQILTIIRKRKIFEEGNLVVSAASKKSGNLSQNKRGREVKNEKI